MKIGRSVQFALMVLLGAQIGKGQVTVLTQHNDNARTGANLNETTLSTSNVTQSNFGKLFWRTVDGFIYAQPLYVSNVSIAGTIHNVVYVATQHDSVYAFDADDPNEPAPLWQVSLGTPVPSQDICIITGDTNPADCPYYDISPEIGITSTPVVDPVAGIIYVVARTKNPDNTYHYLLHALSLTTGAEQLGGPVEITGQVNGTGVASVNGIVTFDPTYHNQRPSLLLQNGTLYIAFGSVGDIGPYHGWIMSYNASTLQEEGVFNDTPDGDAAGIWMTGQGLVGDSSGNVYTMTGDGDFNANVLGGRDYGDSFVKLGGPSLNVSDYFTPMNQETFWTGNIDLGAGGPMLMPGTSFLVGQGKDSLFRVVNTTNMGKFNSGIDNDVQEFTATPGPFFSSPVYWNSPNNGPVVYIWGPGDYLKALQFNGALFNTAPVSEGSVLDDSGFSDAAALSVSADQSVGGTGIVWANMPVSGTATGIPIPGILRAFDATDLTSELWDSNQNPTRDGVGNYAKFVPPTIANGKVYEASFSGQLQVYGLNPPPFSGIQFIQSSSAAPQSKSSSVAVSYSAAQSAGDLNVVIIGWHDTTATVQSVTDSAGNTYTLALGPTAGTGLSESIYYAKNIFGSNGNTVTVTFNQGATNPDIRVLEYSGVATSSPLDVTTAASGSGYIANSGSVATNAANELLIGADMVGSGNTTVMAGAPYNIRELTTPDSDLAADRLVNVPGSYYSWAPLNTTGPWIMQMVTFKAANTSTAPFVSGVAPNYGPVGGGTSVTISGIDFASGATVMFGGAAASNVVVVNSTTITATTPAGSVGAVTVTVTNSNGQSGQQANGFTYISQPTVTGVSPNSGSNLGGTSVTISGTNFASGATVTFGSAAATNVVVVNSTTITAKTPAGSVGAVSVTVTVNGQSGSLASGFTYVVEPSVSSVSPNSGPTAGGTAVTISGGNFASGATVMFGASAATNVVVVSSTTITATTPSGSAGAVTVTVTVNGQSGSLANGFTYNAPVSIGYAQVGSATPQSPTATVSVGYPAAETSGDMNIVVVGWNDTTSTVQSVTDSAGNSYKLAIGPTSGTALRQSIYYAPNIVAGSNTVTVTFSQAAAYPDIRILEYRGLTTLDVTAGASGSGTAASSGSATTSSANELIFGADTISTSTTAAGSGFTARIVTSPDSDVAEDKTVTTTGSYSATASLSSGAWVMQMATFSGAPLPAPTVSGISPNSGATTGGTAVTITGSNFASGATVTFGSTAASNVVVVNSTTITATTPSGSAGAVTVTVTSNGQSGSLASGFTYVVVPAVTSVSPNNGPTSGGAAVTITGSNFATGATVMFGSAAASNVVVVNSTTITATTPAGSVGAVTVTVTNSNGQSGSLASGFTYVAPPTVTGVSPNSGSNLGGTSVTISGTNFASGATVTFGSAAATNVVVVNSTTITATTPAGSVGAVTVTVTNLGAQSGSLASGFTYTQTTSVTPPGNFAAALIGTSTPIYVAGQQYYNSTTQISHTTSAFNSSGADLLVIFVGCHNNTAFTITDSYGNTWLPLAGPSSSLGSQTYQLEGEVFYAPNAKTGANHTITVTLSQPEPLIISIAAISGDNIYSPIDAYSPVSSDQGTYSMYIHSRPLITYHPDDLLFGVVKGFMDKTFTAGTGYTNQSASTGLNFGAETGTAATAGTYTTNFTASAQDYWQSVLTAVNPKPNQSSMSWTAAVGGPITNYFVERCAGVGCSNFSQIANLSGSVLSYTDTAISAGTTYSYRVRAENSAGMFSDYSNVQTVTPIVPTIVSSLTASSLKLLTWNSSIENGGSISQYSIERCAGTGCSGFTSIGTTAGTSYQDTSAVPGTTYSYRVRAMDANGFYGPYSRVATANIPAYLDNAADGGNNAGTTATLSYSFSVGNNSNRLLLVNLVGDTSADDISSVTYGGTSLTLVKKIQTPGGSWHYLYFLLSPATGTNNIMIAAASPHYLASEASSWYNISQSTQPGPSAVDSAAASAEILTATLPAGTSNAIAVESMWAPNDILPGNGSTELIADAATQSLGMFSSAVSPVTPAYPVSVTNTWGGEQSGSSIVASFPLASITSAGITFDNAADGGNNGGQTSTLSYAYTVGTGANRLLIVNLIGGTSSDDISSVTYAGSSMTLLGKVQAASNAWQYIYYLLNPPSGTNNVAITAASVHYLLSQAASWYNVNQSSQPDALATNTATATSTSMTTSITTVAPGSLVLQGVWSDGHLAAGPGTIPIVVESAFNSGGIFVSGMSPVTPAGPVSMTTISDGTLSSGVIMGSFSPAP